MKRLRADSQEVARIMFDKMLEKHSVGYDYIMKNQTINNMAWCSHYSWTPTEQAEYKKWWIDFHYTKVTPKRTKKWLKDAWVWFDLMYGLRIVDENRL